MGAQACMAAINDAELGGCSLLHRAATLGSEHLSPLFNWFVDQIAALKNDSLKGLRNLYGLRLAGNGLHRVESGAFTTVSTLQVLNLVRLACHFRRSAPCIFADGLLSSEGLPIVC